MTIVQYIKETGVATSMEIMTYARSDKEGFETLKRWAREQAANLGVPIEEPTAAKVV